MSRISDALYRRINGALRATVFPGKVIAVDTSNYTCDVEPSDGGATFFNVRLKPVSDSDGNGIIVIPEVDSDVLVGVTDLNQDSTFVVQFGKVKSYLVKTTSGTLEVDAAGTIKLNGDNLGGLIKINSLIQELNASNQLLLAIKNVLTSWAPVSGDGGAALKLAAIGALQQLQPGQFDTNTLENTKVKHG